MTNASDRSGRKIGLYFGSFNPIHMGHLVIANHMATYTNLDEIWLVVTPQNPQKGAHEMIHQSHRFQMVLLAVSENELLQGCDAEFDLPQPNYTAATMRHMRDKHPEVDFSLIIGEDNFERLHSWRDHWELVQNHRILVYPRRSSDQNTPAVPPAKSEDVIPRNHRNIQWCDAPMISISSTYLRRAITDQKDIRYLLHDKVLNYISNNHLYE
jgi:nicotinate-nucleotide adenylyltransferase